jgi:hypothetical protein
LFYILIVKEYKSEPNSGREAWGKIMIQEVLNVMPSSSSNMSPFWLCPQGHTMLVSVYSNTYMYPYHRKPTKP